MMQQLIDLAPSLPERLPPAVVYQLRATVDRVEYGPEGEEIVIPAGSVVSRILWNGVSPYDPGPGLELVLEQ